MLKSGDTKMALPIEKTPFLEYEAINEPWNVYKLKDGSTLRVRIIVSGILKESDNSVAFQVKEVYNVIPNPKYLGVPSPPLKLGEKIEDYVEEEDIMIIDKTENWNTYRVPSENLLVSVRGELVLISRTSRHDERGIPAYLVNIQLLFKPKKKAKENK